MYLKLGKNGKIFSTKYNIHTFERATVLGVRTSSQPILDNHDLFPLSEYINISVENRSRMFYTLIDYENTLEQRLRDPAYKLANGYIYDDSDNLITTIKNCYLVSHHTIGSNTLFKIRFTEYCEPSKINDTNHKYIPRLTYDPMMTRFISQTIMNIIDNEQ